MIVKADITRGNIILMIDTGDNWKTSDAVVKLVREGMEEIRKVLLEQGVKLNG